MLEANAEKYILFEDKDIIVCRKPAGIAVQNARIGAMDLESGLKNYLASAGNGRQIPYLAVVHRLDQPVEGVLVFARNPKAARNLSAQITAGKMEKIYLAVTFGRPAEYEKSETARSTEADSDEIRSGKKHEPKILEDYLKKDGKTNTSSVVSPGTPGAKKARLSYEVHSPGHRTPSPDPGADGACRNAPGRGPQIRLRHRNPYWNRGAGPMCSQPDLHPSGIRKGDEIPDNTPVSRI